MVLMEKGTKLLFSCFTTNLLYYHAAAFFFLLNGKFTEFSKRLSFTVILSGKPDFKFVHWKHLPIVQNVFSNHTKGDSVNCIE